MLVFERCVEKLIRDGNLEEFKRREGEDDIRTPGERSEDKKDVADLIENIITFFGGHDISGSSKRARFEYTKRDKCPSEYVMNRAETGLPCVYPEQDEDIVFTRQDLRCVINPHNDALVIIAQVSNKNPHKVLVDMGASCNLLEYFAFKKTKILDKVIDPISTSIYGIIGDLMTVNGMIRLPITLGIEPNKTTSVEKFIVVDTGAKHNAKLGKPTL